MANPLYLAAGFNGLIVNSTDGRSWTAGGTEKKGHNPVSGVFGDKGVVLCGRQSYKGLTLFSLTGLRWEDVSGEGFPEMPLAVTWHQDRYVAFGGDAVTIGRANAYATASTDGKRWAVTGTIGDGKRAPRAAASDGKRVVIVGDRGAKFASTDLKTWEASSNQTASETLINVIWANGIFVAGGLHGLRMHSRDGLAWTRVEGGEEGEHLNSMLWTGKEFVAVGLGATYRSTNGMQWTRTPNTNAPLSAAYGPSGYVGTRWRGRIVHSPDAITWTEVAQFDDHLNFAICGQI